MAAQDAITAEYVRSILHYDPDAGVLTWRSRPLEHFKTPRDCNAWNARFPGKRAGSYSASLYLGLRINYGGYQLHRVAWLWMTGEWPKEHVDHIDGDRTNNRWSNLREATNAENMRNRGKQKNNTSGYKGVYWDSQLNKWRAQIHIYGKSIYLGIFDKDKKDEAAAAYAKAAREYHGEFARIV